MKKVLKVLGIIIGGIVVIGIIGSLVSNGNDKTTTTNEPIKTEQTQNTTPTTTTPKNDTTQQQPTQQPVSPAPTPEKKTSITKGDFDKMQNGMTYEQVVQAIGVEGELMSESGQKGDQYYTVMYEWKGSGDLGANANAMFQGNKLQSKAQFGLK